MPSVPSASRIRVLAHGHPAVGVDLAAAERLHVTRCRVPVRGRDARGPTTVSRVRLVIARCQVDYVGRLTAHLPMAPRLLLVKADGSVSVHADDRAYKPLNWMSPPCWLEEQPGVWTVRNKADESLVITIDEVLHDTSHELGVDPGLVKDGVEAHLQELLAAHPDDARRRLHAGPPRVHDGDRPGGPAVPRRRRGHGGRGGQAARRDRRGRAAHPLPGAARPRPAADARSRGCSPRSRSSRRPARWREDRGIRCVVVDYDALRGARATDLRLF